MHATAAKYMCLTSAAALQRLRSSPSAARQQQEQALHKRALQVSKRDAPALLTSDKRGVHTTAWTLLQQRLQTPLTSVSAALRV